MDNVNALRYLSQQKMILQYLPLHVTDKRSSVVVGSGECAATVDCAVSISAKGYWDKINPESEMEPYVQNDNSRCTDRAVSILP